MTKDQKTGIKIVMPFFILIHMLMWRIPFNEGFFYGAGVFLVVFLVMTSLILNVMCLSGPVRHSQIVKYTGYYRWIVRAVQMSWGLLVPYLFYQDQVELSMMILVMIIVSMINKIRVSLVRHSNGV